MMKRIFVLLVSTLTLLIVLSPAKAVSTEKQAATHTNKHPAELFFFQHADSGKLTQHVHDKCYQLTMIDSDKKVTYFSRTPERISGQLTIPGFINTWNHNHIKPNAILHATLIMADMKTHEVSDAIIINNATYNHQLNTMTYQVCSMNNAKKLKTGELQNVNLFIDPFHPWPP